MGVAPGERGASGVAGPRTPARAGAARKNPVGFQGTPSRARPKAYRERLDGRCLRMIERDDATLVRRARGGDRGAFAALVERHYERIHRLGARVLGDGGEAEDLAQDVCAGLAARLGSYRGDSLFSTWLYRVVVNAARDALRRDAVRRRREGEHA